MSASSVSGKKKARVVIVDDSRTMQAVLEQILSTRLDIEIVGVAGDVETAISMIARKQPDLVTIDLRLPYIDGRTLLERLAHFPAMHKLVVSAHACDNLSVVSTLEQLGADGCIDKMEISRDPAGFCKKVQKLLAQPKRDSRPADDTTGTRTYPGMMLAAASSFPVPLDEQARLRHLAALHLANDDEDAQLDRLTAHLRRTTDFPSCLMTFIDRDTMWIKSASGFSRGSMARAEGMCNYTLATGDTLLVPDATLDTRFSHFQAVVRAPRIRAYVGHPIVSKAGVRLGTICLLDTRARRIPPAVVINLRGMCDIAASILETRLPELKMCA